MKLWRLALPVYLAAAVSALAIPFSGTFTQTITWSNDSRYEVGTVYQGSFQYESDTIDGTFYSMPIGYSYPGFSDVLTGSLYGGQGRDGNAFDDSSYLSYITIADGIVTNFHWEDQRGWSNPWFNGLDFRFYEGGPIDSPLMARGKLSFSQPTATVPEGGVTAILVGVGLACIYGFVGFRRKYRQE